MHLSALERPFRHYIRIHWRPFALGTLALLLTNTMDALAPLLIGRAIDQITEGVALPLILRTVGLIFCLTLGVGVCRFLWRIFWGRFHHTVAEDLRNRIFARLTEMGPAFFAKRTAGDLMSLINNDVNTFRMAIGPGMLVLFDAIFIGCMIPFLMWRISPTWTWQCLALMPAVPFVVRSILRRSKAAYQNQQDRFSEMAGAAQEVVAGIRVIKSYAQEENQTWLFNRFSRAFMNAGNRVARIDAGFGPVLEMAAAAGSVILLGLGTPLVMAGTVSIGQFFAFYQYIRKMVWPMEGLGVAFSHFQQGRAAYIRVLNMLKQDSDTPDLGTAEVTNLAHLEVRDLTFYYPDQPKPALQHVSFSLRAGEILGVVGTTGAGKSTLAELLCRLYPAPANSILVNQTPIENLTKASLHRLIAYAPQESFLFSRGLSENIALGLPTWRTTDIEWAARLVNLDREIEGFTDQYQTLIGERGVNLSGGQRQRVNIARAMIRKSQLVILDDSLSAVDGKTEHTILENLKDQMVGRRESAAIIISHRLASVRWADRILVLNQGVTEALGTHEELLKKSSTYRHLYELQTDEARA